LPHTFSGLPIRQDSRASSVCNCGSRGPSSGSAGACGEARCSLGASVWTIDLEEEGEEEEGAEDDEEVVAGRLVLEDEAGMRGSAAARLGTSQLRLGGAATAVVGDASGRDADGSGGELA
jgi:hypothetical protein